MVAHRVDQADFQTENADGSRTYQDTLTYAENASAGLTRTPTAKFYVVLANGASSAALVEYAQNSLPVLPGAPTITSTLDGVQVSCPVPSDGDLSGYVAWVGTTADFPLDEAHQRYRGDANSFTIQLADDATYYVRVAPFDAFGLDAASAWQSLAVKRGNLADAVNSAVPAIGQAITALQKADGSIPNINDTFAEARAQVDRDVAEINRQVAADKATLDRDLASVRTDAANTRSEVAAAGNDARKAASDLRDEVSRAKGEEGAINTKVVDLTTRTGNNESAISTETTQRVNADGALSNRLDTVKSTADKNTADISTESSTRANADSALASRTTALEAYTNSIDSTYGARIATEETTRATADNALANRSTTLESRVGASQNNLLTNGTFSQISPSWINDGSGHNPPGWGSWANDNGAYIGPALGNRPSKYGAQYALQIDRQGNENGLYQGLGPQGAGWYVIEADVTFEDGVILGSGMYVVFQGVTDPVLDFGRDPDTNNGILGTSVGNLNRKYSKIVYVSSPCSSVAVYLMASWEGFSNPGQGFLRTIWHKAVVRAASDAEIKAQRAFTTDIPNAVARIAAEESTRASVDSALASKVDSIEATIGPDDNSGIRARIRTEETTRATADSALASRSTSLEARATNSGNLVPNTSFATLDGWSLTYAPNGGVIDRNRAGTAWQIGGVENNLTLYQNKPASGIQLEAQSTRFAVQAGQYYQVYALTANHRCDAWVSMLFFDAAGNGTGYAGENTSARRNAGGQDISGHDITGTMVIQAPPGTVSACVALRMYNAGNDSYAWFDRPYVGLVIANTNQWNAYTPGNDRPVTITTIARIATEEATRASADAAIASRSTVLESKMAGNEPSGLQTLIKNNRRNLIDVGWWKKDAPLAWPTNAGMQNVIYSLPATDGSFAGVYAPDGNSGDVWLCRAGTDAPSGGWGNTPMAPLDPDKTYRFAVPINVLSTDGGGVSYWGTGGVCDLNTTSDNPNPYFAVYGNLPARKWHLFVGYLFPRNSVGKTHDGAGIYDMETGTKLGDGTNYCFRPDGSQPIHRAYQFYASQYRYQAFGRPVVELIDGNETPLFQNLAAKRAVTAATARIATEESTRASADSALASRTTNIESSYSMPAGNGGVVTNPEFNNYPDGSRYPRGWSAWLEEGPYAVSRVAGRNGSLYAVQITNDANVSSGFFIPSVYFEAGKYVIEATVENFGGSWNGSGITLSGAYNLDFAGDPDINGQTGDIGQVTRSWSKTFDLPAGPLNVHAMHGWFGFGRGIASHYLRWYRVNVRRASAGEALSYVNSARISSEETTRASVDLALSNKVDTLQSQFRGDTDSTVLARIRTEESTRAAADSALATRSTRLESASIVPQGGAQNNNPKFALWYDGFELPNGWARWAWEGNACVERQGGLTNGSPYKVRTLNDNENVEFGFFESVRVHPGVWILEVTVSCVSGYYAGSGITLSGIYSLDFSGEADTNGQTTADPLSARLRTWTKTFNITQDQDLSLHAMSHWSGFGRYRAPKYLDWYNISLRPADAGTMTSISNTARIATEETTRANAVSAVANRTSVVEATVASDAQNMVRNGIFNAPGWTGGIPPYWGPWIQDGGAYIGPLNRGTISPYGAPNALQIDRNGYNNGIAQVIQGPIGPGWYVFEVDITGEDGNWSGSGVHCNFNNGSSMFYGFALNPDTAGRSGDIGNANRKFSWLYYNGASSNSANLYLMSGWEGFQGRNNYGFVRMIWNRIVMRPASDAEIQARKVQDSNLIARVSTNESAVSGLNGRTRAYWETTAVAGNNRAQLTIRADANGGAGVDIVGDVAISGNLLVSGTVTSGKVAQSAISKSSFQTLTQNISIAYG